MNTINKPFDRIFCIILACVLIFVALFLYTEDLGIKPSAAATIEYENKLFDNSEVHSIDILMDNWDEFLENCTNEEYFHCSVVIDGETYENVAIRAKGNTSLTQVKSYGNNRYSFKIEFDHYDSSMTYHGLDKLCLNNIIQDNTYMKDFLCYEMMNFIGIASPLASYTYITVNGEDWGLYLAVEAVEEAFLERNYGADYGELYKPDSSDFGGGRGNGQGFDLNKFLENENSENVSENANTPQLPDGMQHDTQTPSDSRQAEPKNLPNQSGSVQNTPESPPDSSQNMPELPDNMQAIPENFPEKSDEMGDIPSDIPENADNAFSLPDGFSDTPGEKQTKDFRNGSDDVLLKYIDDDPESYSNIFDNAKTPITSSDKERLIQSLKNLSSGEKLSETVSIDSVIRYFVVHNFVLNFDSYTGSMIHNYYLYEKDGQMQMIPWDYNLAFGGFQSMGSATNLVNYPIDSPVSGGNAADRPMIAWIFNNEEYTELYHQYFSEFISEYFDSGYFEDLIDRISAMISPYVEKDPTKFCTYEEFETGIATLTEFCTLRAESITEQLSGTIGSTSETQQEDTLIDAGNLQISDMGSMNMSSMGKDKDDKMPSPPDGFSAQSENTPPNRS